LDRAAGAGEQQDPSPMAARCVTSTVRAYNPAGLIARKAADHPLYVD
jgi:hypothetical protein